MVACRAAMFGARFAAEEEASVAGLLHDIGKYGDLFPQRLRGEVNGIDHWSIGAHVAAAEFGPTGLAAAFAIHGHHVGLKRPSDVSSRLDSPHPLGLRHSSTDRAGVFERFTSDGLRLPTLRESVADWSKPLSAMAAVRFLFSTLVDADFLETEAHFARDSDGQRTYRAAAPLLRPDVALPLVEAQIASLAGSPASSDRLRQLRQRLAAACEAAGSLPQGAFTLSAPTGSGKTLAMLRFALRHAQAHSLDRIIIVVPFLSIIEQTARVLRTLLCPVLGDDYVLEHHSLGDDVSDDGDGASSLARLAAENWDAPVVLTTSVQFLESLFASRPSRCRKLHRIARSVVLFDEVQTLPVGLAVPTLGTLGHLAERLATTVVFATATQPAFDVLDAQVAKVAAVGWRPVEIAPGLPPPPPRTSVSWETRSPIEWDVLASRMAASDQALCIVNMKADAVRLFELVRALTPEATYHLSTNMCSRHRRRVLEEVRGRLSRREACRLVSTQCVEAGVDIDFPVVHRALAPFDALVQAAGRCNRNAGLDRGEFRVFLPVDAKYPQGGYRRATDVTIAMLEASGHALDLEAPAMARLFYQNLYSAIGADPTKERLRDAIHAVDFEQTASEYRVIDQSTVNVVVPFDVDVFERLWDDAITAQKSMTRDWIKRARPYAVSVFERGLDALPIAPVLASGDKPRWYMCTSREAYDDAVGLRVGHEVWIA